MSLSKPHDFAADVLDTLQRRKVTFRGCSPWYIEQMGKDVKIWFYGRRDGRPWAGGITVISPEAETALATGDSRITAELCEKIIDHSQTRFK